MIEIEHLSKTFGHVNAVRDLTLAIPRGELFCFLGPNGAGKTTTIKMLCGLLRPTSGSIKLDGLDIHARSEEWRRKIGYIPDTPFLYERLTPAEFLEFIADLYGIPRPQMIADRTRFFAMFDMDSVADALIKDLSHGYRQRLIYAATFLHRPGILFVDEPFVGLDPRTIRMIRDLLRAKAREGMTIFLTTHILAFAEHLADRIGIISEGVLTATGTLEELKALSSLQQGSLEDIFFSLIKQGENE